jgi:hypothetical protein
MYIVDMNNDDFVLYQQGGEIISGGYSINSFFLREGIAPMKSFNNDLNANADISGGGCGSKKNDISSSFDSFAVPAGLFYIYEKKKNNYGNGDADEHKKNNKDNDFKKDHNMLPDDIYEKLFQLAQFNKQKKNKLTKKHKKTHPLKKTRRNANDK